MASRKKNLNAQPVMNTRVGRMTPVAVAVSVVLGGGHSVADAGVALRMAMPAIRPGSISTNFAAPVAGALPKPVKSLTDADGNAQNIASSGNTTGVQDDKQHVLTLSQGSAKAIVQFNSFDIGSSAAVNVYMNNADGGSALYQVTNSTSPSQLYGALNSFTKGADGQYKTGGEIFLINQNGILFGHDPVTGHGAQVNVGGLFGSALGVDEADFLSGFKNSMQGHGTQNPTSTFGDSISLFAPEQHFVKVDTGAKITTSSGGRVFLLGGQVENAGSISTPNGQTVLAAGQQVYLNDPTNGTTKLYMSEVNDKVPTVKGLLVEVNGGQTEKDFATNSGSINTPTGNTTIVGWAVNQRGRISATTSVTQNGSVYLLARSGTTAIKSGTLVSTYAQKGGSLTLDEGSSVEIKPDTTTDVNGQVLTTNAAGVFTPSRVELSGRTIEFKNNAQIIAPNATVNVRAENTPTYDADHLLTGRSSTESADANARIIMGSGAAIDVSGTQDTSVSVARNFVTTDLLGYQDLKDAPLQKDGPIYRSKLTLDIRQTSPILGPLQSYRDAVLKSADEFMSAGGNVTLSAGAAVVMHPTARIDVSGGQVNYTDAPVSVSVLVAEDGQRYTLNNAPADVKYVAIEGKESSTTTRFGTFKVANSNPVGKKEPGYVDGQAAGSLTVYAPVALLDGQLKGAAKVGARQLAGTDQMAKAGTLNVGANFSAAAPIGSKDFQSAIVNDVQIVANVAAGAQSVSDTFWSNPLDSDLGTTISRISAQQINASGFGNLNVTANHGIEQVAGANLNLIDHASVAFQTSAKPVVAPPTSDTQREKAPPALAAGVVLGANTRSVGGTFKAAAYESGEALAGQIVEHGTVDLKASSKIDMSGNWVNQRLDGKTVAAASYGGSVALQSDHGLTLEDGSVLNVSGGVTVSTAGAFSGSKAGSIVLEGMNRTKDGSETVSIGHNVSLNGYSLSQGGSVRIKTGDVTISDAYSGLSQGDGTSSLNIGSDFFSQGGFLSYDIDGRNSLLIRGLDSQGRENFNTHIQPHAVVWQALASGRNAATGSNVAQYIQADLRPETVRKPVTLAFKSSGADAKAGRLSVETGAVIHPDAMSSVSFTAAHSIDLDGAVVAKGGKIAANIQINSPEAAAGELILGKHALLDVSGGAVLTPNNNGRLLGSMVNGGSIQIGVSNTLEATDATVDIQAGSRLQADGGVGQLDVARIAGTFGAAYTRQTLASDGGDINIQAGHGGANLSGSMSARAGNTTAQGGTLTVGLAADSSAMKRGSTREANILQIQTESGPNTVQAQALILSTQAVRDGGFANLYVSSLDQIQFDGNVSLGVSSHLRLEAPVLNIKKTDDNKTYENTRVFLNAGSTLQLGNGLQDTDPLSEILTADGGRTQLLASAGLIELFGKQTTQGIGRLGLVSQSELRLRGVGQDSTVLMKPGMLDTQADVVINAPQVVPTTAADYTLNAPGKTVTFTGGDVNAQTPLSAGSSLTVNAGTINQNGVIKAPFGSINLNATDSLNLGAGSLTSVSGEDLLVPYGTTTGGGKNWTYGNAAVTSFQDKAITLNANGQSVNEQAGSVLNLSGGGNLVGWEFVPGPGGSKDIFAGSQNGAFAIVPTIKSYAPYDSAILSTDLSLNPSVGNSLSLGNTVTFGNGGPVAAGTYAVLPARYALLPGAFLIKPASGANGVGMGYSMANADGSYTVGAMAGVSGTTTPGNARAGAYTVMSSEVARRYSEITNTYADEFMAKQAAVAGTATPMLAADAGRLSVLADKLQLDGQIQFAHAAGKRGGQLDIASNKIHVGTSSDAQADALNLTYDQLNKTGADSIMLGGVRKQSNSDGSVDVSVASQWVQVDASGNQALSVGDLILTSQDKVVLGDGAQIRAASSDTASALLNLSGDGALLRVSSDVNASTQRTGATGASGQLLVGQKVSLQGGAITAEATQSTQIASGISSAASFKADKLVLGASRVEVGGHDPVSSDAPLTLQGTLLEQVSSVKDLTVRSFSSVDLFDSVLLGGDKARNLTVDAASVRVMTEGGQASLVAGGVSLRNTTQSIPDAPTAGTGTLIVQATGRNGGTGHVSLGEGQVAISGVQATTVKAAGSVVVAGQGGLTVPGDLTIQAQSLTAKQAADSQLSAQGTFTLKGADGTASVAKATPGAGAALALTAQSVQQNGRIELPSGKLSITADQAVSLGATSQTDLSGLVKTIDGQAIATVGGDLAITAKAGDIHLAEGGVVNVSAGLGASHAGSMTFSAVNGAVDLQGRLLATSTTGQKGGSLNVDAQQAVDVAALANRIAAETSASVGNFTRSIELRNRAGDQAVQAGSTLSSSSLTITTDAGNLTVAGGLHANGEAGGTVTLAAGADVVIAAGADVQAKALTAGRAGGQVAINSVGGQIELQGGSIDTSGSGSGANGSLSLRALRTDTGVAVSPIGTTLVGVDSVTVEAVRHYDQTTLTYAQLTQIKGDNSTYLSAVVDGVNGSETVYQNILDTLSGGQSDLLAKLKVRTGVEIDSSDNLTLSPESSVYKYTYTDPSDSSATPQQLQYKYERGLDLTQNDGLSAPSNWTFRVAGNLAVQTSLGQGFVPDLPAFSPTDLAKMGLLNKPPKQTTYVPSRVAQGGVTGGIRLIGGADMTSANVMATVASADVGDVVVGDTAGARVVAVSNTVGNIDIAAGHDVSLLNSKATVYTTGRPVLAEEAQGYSQPSARGLLFKDATTPFLTGGGNVTLAAQNDVSMNMNANQFVTDWWYRWKNINAADQVSWFSRYDLFKQGIAAFGGGDVTVLAGRDAVNVNASAVASGYTVSGVAQSFGGGSAAIVAGRDVVGGAVMASEQVSVVAGRNISRPATSGVFADAKDLPASLQVLYGQGNTEILARNNLTVGRLLTAGQLAPSKQASLSSSNYGFYLYGPLVHASLDVSSSAGDLTLDGVAPRKLTKTTIGNVQDAFIVPDQVSLSAASGSIDISSASGALSMIQATSDSNADISILARDSVVLGASIVQSSAQSMSGAVMASNQAASVPYGADVYSARMGGTDRTPLRVVAETGDVIYMDKLLSTQSVRMIAGGDIVAGGDGNGYISAQHQTANEMSLIQAGRDIQFSTTPTARGLDVSGPGDLVLVSGRSLDLKTTEGIKSLGNLHNFNLPKGSANITVLTGVDFAKGDVTDAANAYYQLLGGQGVWANSSLLYEQIKEQQAVNAVQLQLATDGSNHTPEQIQQAIANAAATAKAAAQADLEKPDALLTLARNLAGDAAYQKAMDGYDSHFGSAVVTGSGTKNAAVDPTKIVPKANFVANQLLTQVWSATVPEAKRIQAVVGMLSTASHERALALQSFMQQQFKLTLSDSDIQNTLNALTTDRTQRESVLGNLVLNLTGQKQLTADEKANVQTAAAMTWATGNEQALRAFVQQRTGLNNLSTTDALKQFALLPAEQQSLLITKVLSDEVSANIAEAASVTGSARDAAYGKAYLAIGEVFPGTTSLPARLNMGASRIKTMQGSAVRVFDPNGDINVGQLTASSISDTSGMDAAAKLAAEKAAADLAAQLGLVTAGGGDLTVLARDNVAVNNSRIFTVVKGDEVIWSSLGNVDAGRGAKTVTSTPAPVFYLDSNGQLQIDVTSAISGSGISATGIARIAAPKGEINAGDAGIQATGGLDLAASVIRGADAIVSPVVHGAPPAPAVNMAVSAATPTQPTAAGPSDSKDQDEEAKKKKRKRSVLLDFLGFGSEDNR